MVLSSNQWSMLERLTTHRRGYRIFPGRGTKKKTVLVKFALILCPPPWYSSEKILWGPEQDIFLNIKSIFKVIFMYFKRVFMLFWQLFSKTVAPPSELQGGVHRRGALLPLVSTPGDISTALDEPNYVLYLCFIVWRSSATFMIDL